MPEHMGTPSFVTAAVMTVIMVVAARLFTYGRNPRTLLAGIGPTLLLPGLFLTEMSDLLVSSIEGLITWAGHTG